MAGTERALAGTERAIVTPENRDHMIRVLREQIGRGLFPAATPDHPPSLTYSDERNDWSRNAGVEALVQRFRRELDALAGFTYPVESVDEAAAQIAELALRFDTTRLLAWDAAAFDALGVPGLIDRLASRGLSIVAQQVPFDGEARRDRLAELDPIPLGLTGADAGLAESGSIVLGSGPGRGRLASLLAPVHVAVLRRDRLVFALPDLFRLRPDLAAMPGSNLVCITGPSRTADIEMTLSRGVHGPREVHVILL
jgi:L-lactate dehydrogenase complex protein LldG